MPVIDIFVSLRCTTISRLGLRGEGDCYAFFNMGEGARRRQLEFVRHHSV